MHLDKISYLCTCVIKPTYAAGKFPNYKHHYNYHWGSCKVIIISLQYRYCLQYRYPHLILYETLSTTCFVSSIVRFNQNTQFFKKRLFASVQKGILLVLLMVINMSNHKGPHLYMAPCIPFLLQQKGQYINLFGLFLVTYHLCNRIFIALCVPNCMILRHFTNFIHHYIPEHSHTKHIQIFLSYTSYIPDWKNLCVSCLMGIVTFLYVFFCFLYSSDIPSTWWLKHLFELEMELLVGLRNGFSICHSEGYAVNLNANTNAATSRAT